MENNHSSSHQENQLAMANLFDPALVRMRKRTQDLCFKLNHTKPSKHKKRKNIIQQLNIKTKSNVTITSPFYCSYGENIEMGKNFFCNYNCIILDRAPVIFKDYVMIGPNACFATVEHPLDIELRQSGDETFAPIVVEDHVWIGANVTVLSGVTIGEGSVIGAGSVVTKDIPPFSIAHGIPCKVVKQIETKKLSHT